MFSFQLTRFLAVEVRAVRVQLSVFVNWTFFCRIDIVKRCGEASTVVDVLSVKLTVLIVGLEKRTYGRGRCQSVSRTYTHLHVHLEDAEAVGERAVARKAAHRHRHPPRPPLRAPRHERGLRGPRRTPAGGKSAWGDDDVRQFDRRMMQNVYLLYNLLTR